MRAFKFEVAFTLTTGQRVVAAVGETDVPLWGIQPKGTDPQSLLDALMASIAMGLGNDNAWQVPATDGTIWLIRAHAIAAVEVTPPGAKGDRPTVGFAIPSGARR